MLETPMFTRVVNVVNVQRAVFQGARGGRGAGKTRRRGDGGDAENEAEEPEPNRI